MTSDERSLSILMMFRWHWLLRSVVVDAFLLFHVLNCLLIYFYRLRFLRSHQFNSVWFLDFQIHFHVFMCVMIVVCIFTFVFLIGFTQTNRKKLKRKQETKKTNQRNSNENFRFGFVSTPSSSELFVKSLSFVKSVNKMRRFISFISAQFCALKWSNFDFARARSLHN